jgi:hypothetical protein
MAGSPWGGSEELWSRAALRLLREGHVFRAAVKRWPTPVARVQDLVNQGIPVDYWSDREAIATRAIKKLCERVGVTPMVGSTARLKTRLKEFHPDLLVVSQGGLADGSKS